MCPPNTLDINSPSQLSLKASVRGGVGSLDPHKPLEKAKLPPPQEKGSRLQGNPTMRLKLPSTVSPFRNTGKGSEILPAPLPC